MSVFDQIINWGPVARIRRNHSLEHATLQVLAEKNPQLKMVGYSDTGGFWLIGNVETAQVWEAVQEALNRLRGGEPHLAIHPHCGTNLVTTGLMAGSFAWLGMVGTGRDFRERMERWPLVVTLVTLAMLVAQPLGPMMQARVTTSTVTPQMEIVKVEKVQRGDVPMHRVGTRD